MERLSAIALGLPSEESTAVSKVSARQLRQAEIMQLDQMLSGMVAYYPHQEIPDETLIQYREEFKLMAVGHSLANLREAFLTVRRRSGQTFFPHPSEVQKELEEMAKKAQQEAQKQLPPLGCAECKDSIAPGLLSVQENGERVVRLCACKVRRNQARAGMQPQSAHYDAKAKAAGE